MPMKPALAYLSVALRNAFTGPGECFEATRSLFGDRAATKILHPFYLSAKVYSGLVWASRDDHWPNDVRLQADEI